MMIEPEDLADPVAMKCFAALSSGNVMDGKASLVFTAYSVRILRNLVIDHKRAWARGYRPEDQGTGRYCYGMSELGATNKIFEKASFAPDPGDAIDARCAIDLLSKVARELGGRYPIVAVLLIRGHLCQSIARLLGINETNVAYHIHNLRSRFRRELRNRAPDLPVLHLA